jgi:signal transduction histidine kinase
MRLPRPRLPRLPVRSIRARIALACGGLFLLVGSLLIAVTYRLVGRMSGDAVLAAEMAITKDPSVHTFYLECKGAAGSALRQSPDFAAKCRYLFALGARAGALNQGVSDRHEFLLYSITGLVITSMLAALLGWVASARILGPVRAMTDTARRASQENLHLRLALPGPRDELTELADTFDDMLARLDDAFASQRRFVANASHELRTPLTEMRTLIDVTLAKRHRTPEQLESVMSQVRAGVRKSDELIEALLTLARSDQGLSAVELVDLPTAVEDAVDVVSSVAARRGISVETELGSARTAGDRVLLDRLVTNLVDNAVRHNETGGWVRVRTACHNGSCLISVANGGPVIPAESLPELTEPFRRLAGRVASVGPAADETGCGLGMSIVASVVSAHGGSLALRAPACGGLEVDVLLPATPDPADPAVLRAAGSAPQPVSA